jgi:hypothetical protein
MNMRPHKTVCLPLVALAAGLALPLAPAQADTPSQQPFAAYDPLPENELGDLRGGMMIGGIAVDFAVVVRTTVAGATGPLGIQTTLAVNDAGGLAGAITTALGDAAANGATLSGTGGGGLAMVLKGGGTTLMQQVINDQMQSLIANRSNNMAISHSTDLNVTMPGFQGLTQTWFSHAHAAHLGFDSATAGLGRF